jgi:tRNA nucleotidyltransferase (CCA-adding enzyme)
MPKPRGPQFEPINLLTESGSTRSFKALYHGTPKNLEGVTEISPEFSTRPGRNLSFATPSLPLAKGFAGEEGYVYQVEPTDRENTDDTWLRQMKHARKGALEVVSSKGFRVLRQVHPKQSDS